MPSSRISGDEMALLIGCSGWSYKDWVGPFYPKDVAKKEWLAYYGRFFPTVEINSTFYAIPNKYTIEAWMRKGRAIQRARKGNDFRFSVKMPQRITHELLVKGKVDDVLDDARTFDDVVLGPLGEFGLGGAVLVQLSPNFKFDTRSGKRNLLALDRLLEDMTILKWDRAVEFRHRTWIGKDTKGAEGLVPEAMDVLRKHGAILVRTDGPGFSDLKDTCEDKVYVRFHGRNQDIWFKKGSGSSNGMEKASEASDPQGRFNRYDYLYSGQELEPWTKEIDRDMEGFVYFNNHPRGKGPKNALMIMDMLGIVHEPKDIKIASQQRLF